MAPALTGIALRDRTVRDYKRAAERAGAPVDLRQLEQQAIADCHTYDAVMRTQVPTAPAPPDPEKQAEREAALDVEAAKVGATVARDQTFDERPLPALHTAPTPMTKSAFALGRIHRIVSGATPHRNPKIMCSTCEIPELAEQVLRLFALFASRHRKPRPGDEPNPFYGRRLKDIDRMMTRAIEDICDRSTGRLGPWWIPGQHFARNPGVPK